MSMLPEKAISEDSFFSFGVGGLGPQASYAIMPLPLQVYDDYYVLTAICTTYVLFPIMHLVLVLPLGLYLPIHLYILAILICRLVDLSTCRPVDLVLLSRTKIYICHLYVLPKLNCRLVDLSTCRVSAIVNNKDPDRVRVSVWLGLWLG